MIIGSSLGGRDNGRILYTTVVIGGDPISDDDIDTHVPAPDNVGVEGRMYAPVNSHVTCDDAIP